MHRLRESGAYGPRAGIALPGALVLMALLVGVTGWLLGHLREDEAQAGTAASFDAQAALAEAAAERVALDLAGLADWRPVGVLAPPTPCVASALARVALDVPAEGVWAQAEMDAVSRWGADTPRWQLAWQCDAVGLLGRWPRPGRVPAVLVWLADDPEGDGLPLWSANQRLHVRALAVGADGARGVVSGTIQRAAPGAPVQLVGWRSGPRE